MKEQTMTPIAALIYRGEGNDELRLLWQAVENWRRQGLRVAGLLNKLDANGNKMRDRTASLTDSREYAIMYDGGCSDDACLLDPHGLAASSEVIREALASPPDILVFNKFGHTESENSGLIEEYAAAVGAGIPVVSLLSEKYLPEWRNFTDGMGTELAGTEDLAAWAAAVAAG
ncbi:DUF2478 domain-containing protein [Neisseria chenwenguii]|uniref:DUF2478 domain-containing protein n=1 Tax=Neisseria chenwenguii TaxID=1853278 RepID=UPI000F4E2F8A|nr:DUF2478 domain-containing protein [Neisseria chenwenguii]ROV56083.1 DUF2478 domain-containing protein [Neisseria chenwenguii]